MNPYEPPKSNEQATEVNRSKQSRTCFLVAGAQFLVYMAIFSWADQQRERWLILIGLETGFCAAICGGIGALLGSVRVGVFVGVLLRIVAFCLLGVPC